MQQLNEIMVADRCLRGDEFRLRVLRAATGLSALNVGAGDFVAVLMRNDTTMLEAFAAAQHIGAYAVPLNWHSRADENGYVLADCGARVLIVHADLWEEIAPAVPAGTAVVCVVTPPELTRAFRIVGPQCAVPAGLPEWESWLATHEPSVQPARAALDTVFYTSGTTGKPKGVRRQVPTPDLVAQANRMREIMYGSMGAQSRALLCAPLYHGGPNSFGLRAMRQAGVLVMPPRFDAEGLLADIERHRITHLYAVATMFVRLIALPLHVRERYDLSSLVSVIHGGSPCSPALKRAMINWWGPVISEYYGSTELGPVSFGTSAEWLAHPGTAGRALPGVQLEIHGDNGEPKSIGEVGEIWAYNHGYPDFTYLNRPEARAELQRGAVTATGDIGYLDEDGYLYVCDRKRDMVISGGVNIYPAEIEQVLMEMPHVLDCAVFGIPDEEFGEALAAYVQPQPGAGISVVQAQEFLAMHLARFKVPRVVEIRDSLPREDSGKIKKRLLRDAYWQAAGRRI